MDSFTVKRVLGASLCAMLLTACSTDKTWLEPTGNAASVPKEKNQPFEQYISESRENIRNVLSKVRFKDGESPYVGGYNLEQVVDMRAPFQIPAASSALCTDTTKGAGKGFLLIHGLTDSPFLLKDMANSLAIEYPCALIRAVLLPGHGTVVGDSLTMRYQDWQGITEYGVNSFNQDSGVQDLYLVGFSTGTALAIKHLQEGESQQKIKGLILLSAAVKASSNMAWLASYVKVFKSWLEVKKERDAARYSSFSFNAGSQFYELTKNLDDEKYKVDIPLLMAVSADDATINAVAAREFFCNKVSSERKLLLWYKGFSNQQMPSCAGIREIAKPNITQTHQGQTYQYANLAHTGISVSPDNAHYGAAGKYRDCKAYEQDGDDNQWNMCMKDEGRRVFAEKNVANMQEVLGEGGMWRRGTFNKDYQQLVGSIRCFVDNQCDLNTIK